MKIKEASSSLNIRHPEIANDSWLVWKERVVRWLFFEALLTVATSSHLWSGHGAHTPADQFPVPR